MHNGGRPTIGVVIPVYARTQGDVVRLMEALNRLSQQTRQPDYLILVDDGSPLAIPSIIRCGPCIPRKAIHVWFHAGSIGAGSSGQSLAVRAVRRPFVPASGLWFRSTTPAASIVLWPTAHVHQGVPQQTASRHA